MSAGDPEEGRLAAALGILTLAAIMLTCAVSGVLALRSWQ